jgi:hypothetical protein
MRLKKKDKKNFSRSKPCERTLVQYEDKEKEIQELGKDCSGFRKLRFKISTPK